jgi:hypothetical protein
VGTTGGGPDILGSAQMPVLTWEQLAGDLRLARQFCDQILIHSLEGCVWQGILPRLRSFEWPDVEGPPDGTRAAAALRQAPRAALWASAHLWRGPAAGAAIGRRQRDGAGCPGQAGRPGAGVLPRAWPQDR